MADIERLRQLRRVVSDTPDDLFDMRYLGLSSPPHAPRCAFGLARRDPWFRANTGITRVGFRLGSLATANPLRVAALFGVGMFDAMRLFGRPPGATATRADVVANIDRLIAGKRAVRYGAK